MAKPKQITFTPSEPIESGGETYEKLTVQRMRVKHMVAMDKLQGDMRKTVALFASMADVPMAVIDDLDMDDFERLSKEIAPLMGNSARLLAKQAESDEGEIVH